MENETPKFEGYSTRDLQKFGINLLTYESCAIGLRGLYNLSSQGVDTVERCFSIKLGEDSPSNWNSKVGSLPAIKSIKLSGLQARDLLIAALADRNAVVAVFVPREKESTLGYGVNEHIMAGNWAGHNSYCNDNKFLDDNYIKRLYYHPKQDSQPHVGLDNQHYFSGRV